MRDNELSIDVLGVLRGCIGAVVGVNDWDIARMGEATELVVYLFGTREKAHLASRELKRTRDMRLPDVDSHFGIDTEVVLGAGKPPSSIALYPIKVRVLAEHGFRLDPMRAFERAVELIEEGAWGEHPGAKPPTRARAAAERQQEPEAFGDAGPKAGRLGCSPRMDAAIGRSYTAPQFTQQVRGYERKIHPMKWGTDEYGQPILGRRWVNSYPRYDKKTPEGDPESSSVPASDLTESVG